MKKILSISCIVCLCGVAWASSGTLDEQRARIEETGEYENNVPSRAHRVKSIRLDQVLLIPESTGDVVGMYDPYDGTYLGDIIVDDPTGTLYNLQTPINAIPGPDGNIYLSDQISDAVFVFDTSGTFLYTYADTTDGLDNIRGIDFRDDHLFVTSGDDYVAEFDGPHSLIRYFIQDGSDPFDILFLDDGRSLLSDIQGSTDNIRLYDTSGTLLYELFPVDFPEQIQVDSTLPGGFLNNSFSANQITDFELDGTIINTLYFDSGRGVYRLGNGNLLATNGDGVFEIDPGTGSIIEQENTGSARFIELCSAAVGVQESEYKPGGTTSLHMKPNPFARLIKISFGISKAGQVEAVIYSVLGVQVAVLLEGLQSTGNYTLTWDGKDDDGRIVNEGVYFLRLTTPDGKMSKKITFVK
ncbi:MAG: T9SS type A sorting domain-containing protein [candidate division WOR-3 bacterium]|nr:MAG: T9SS type A sorting domain-containing protein [candidate division WOR-3 bacterium]